MKVFKYPVVLCFTLIFHQASQYKGLNYANAHVVTKGNPLKN